MTAGNTNIDSITGFVHTGSGHIYITTNYNYNDKLQFALDKFISNNDIERLEAMKWLAETKQKDALPLIEKSFKEEIFNEETDPELRYWIAVGLSMIGGEKVKNLLSDFHRQACEKGISCIAIEDALKIITK